MKCPYCQNNDESLLEFLSMLDYVFPVVYKYLCMCCSKTFLTEEKPNGDVVSARGY